MAETLLPNHVLDSGLDQPTPDIDLHTRLQENSQFDGDGPSVAAVSGLRQPNALQRIIDAGRERAADIHDLARSGARVFLGTLALGGPAVLAPDIASASSSDNGPKVTTTFNITSETVNMSGSVNNGSQFNTSKANVTFLSFVEAKGLRENQILKDKRGKDRCFDANGMHGYNSGLTINSPTHPTNINQVDWYPDNAPGIVCHVPLSVSPSGFARKLCGNLFKFNKPPAKETVNNEVVLVQSWLNATIKLSAKAKAHADSTCIAEAPGAFSEGHGEGNGTGSASIVLKLKDYVKSRGQGQAIARISGSVKAEAEAAAKASASSNCVVESSTTTTTTTTPPGSPPPPSQPQPPHNLPPIGNLAPPLHEFVNDQAPVCVDNISDPDGDPVSVAFTFTDTSGNTVGQQIGNVYQQQPGTDCVVYEAPSTPQQVNIQADLNDGRGGDTNLFNTLPIVPNQF